MTQPKAILLNDTTSFNHHGCHVVVEQIRRYCETFGLNLWHTVKLGEDWRAECHRERLIKSDIVIVNGEGVLHGGRRLAIDLVQSAAFCRELKKPSFLINSVYQNNTAEMAHFVSQFDLVFVRESRSRSELRREGIRSEVVPDMTLSCVDLPRVGLSATVVTDSSCELSNTQLHDFYTRTHGAELASLFRPLSASQRVRRLGAQILGKRVVKRLGLDWHREGKLRSSLFGAAPLEPLNTLTARISSASLIVTGRFHMVCMAMLARTPFVALPGNSHKIEGMLEDASIPHRCRSSLADVNDLLKESRWSSEELTRVDAYVQNARAQISEMFLRIRQAAD